MEIPVEVGSDGLATKVHVQALGSELAPRQGEAREQAKEQSKLLYDAPSHEELGHLKELSGEERKG